MWGDDDDEEDEAILWKIARQMIEEFGDQAGPIVDARIQMLFHSRNTDEHAYWLRLRAVITLLGNSDQSRVQ